MKGLLILVVSLVAVAADQLAQACTTFCLDKGGSLVVGKNYDWSVEDGLVVVNKRGLKKTAYTKENPASWTSRFGSVTFNQYGHEFPSGGINERGVVVELMWLEDTEYPTADARGALPTLQWIQYQLDTAESVDDIVASDASVRIAATGTARIHFMVADATGSHASIEFLDGKMVVHRDDTMPLAVLANDTYASSLAYCEGTPETQGMSSLARFARAAGNVKTNPARGAATIGAAFDLLAEVAQGDYTQWSIVYDIAKKRVMYRTRSHPTIRFLNLEGLDFACTTPAQAIDINAPVSGNVAPSLSALTYKTNYALVRASFTKTDFLRAVPLRAREEMAHYPEKHACEGTGQ